MPVRYGVTPLLLLLLLAATPALQVHFVEAPGPAFRHQSSATSHKYLPETMGGGVAVFDYDNDGRLDVFFTNGAALADPMTAGKQPDKSDPKFWNRLYHQNSDGTFTDVTEHAGLKGIRYNMGVAVGDFDNDGFADLYVTGFSANTFYRNNGNGTFTDVTAKAGVAANGWSTSAGFLDYDNDGLLDLFVGRYVEWSFRDDRYCGLAKPGARAYCHPDNFAGVPNLLFHNNGDGTFTDVSAKAGIANPKGKTLGITFADFDHDGFTDIFAANDSVQCFLYRNNHDGTFTDVSLMAGVGFNEDGKAFAGMGADFSDYDNDGWPDLVVTDLSNERYLLFHNNRDGTFTDATHHSGLGQATYAYSGWSTRFLDYDNDGWKDLFVAQGHVMDTIESISPNLRYLQPPLLLKNAEGRRFRDASAGAPFQKAWAGRGAAVGDLDNDGDLDIIVGNVGQSAYLLRNEGGQRNGWITVQTTGTRSNRDGLGCQVKVVTPSGLTQHYTVQTTAGYLSASDRRLVIGLAGESKAQLVELRWPSGLIQTFENIRSGQTLQAIEPAR